MRYWRIALEHIRESSAASATPEFESRTDTGKALVGAIKELELQCRERIDLLETLRFSRQELRTAPKSRNQLPSTILDAPMSPSKEFNSQGIASTFAWAELSRLPLLDRPSLPARVPTENVVCRSSGVAVESLSPLGSPQHWSESPRLPSRDGQVTRPSSPEKHTMRTTLRSGRAGEKSSKPLRKTPVPLSEGPGKAATLAWTDRLRKVQSSDSGSSALNGDPRKFSDRHLDTGAGQPQWDCHSRRLILPRDSGSSNNTVLSSSISRYSEGFPGGRPSLLSVTAASSALNSSSSPELPISNRSSRMSNSSPRNVTVTAQLSKTSKARTNGPEMVERPNEIHGKNPGSAPPSRGAAMRPTHADQSTNVVRERVSRMQQNESSKALQVTGSSSSKTKLITLKNRQRRVIQSGVVAQESPVSVSSVESAKEEDTSHPTDKDRNASVLQNLPLGIDEAAARKILNDVVVQGDEVHWRDVAGLEIAKNALRETVVYPFLRPDLFMGLREPARGMLLFGPPGTGKTMLARAVATESKSTFFSISASSLTSKYMGESEKLVKALFGLARVLAPSIIFVDEIDSLLSQRSGSGEHEATRRIKTEFLIQWSDLQRAAAGRDMNEKDKERGDANRVLVLAATNLPWAIDEAARRRFVRRQYIPLPEPQTRKTQLCTLLGQQKHSLASIDIQNLVELTEGKLHFSLSNSRALINGSHSAGFSGSDITALAKDAAMGPLRSLGEALLHMTMDEIRPIMLHDFKASLGTIRPSVSKAGLKQHEDWAKEFGERGG